MRISWKWVFIIPAILLTGPFLFLLVTNPFTILDHRRYLGYAFGAFFVCGLAALVSLIIYALDDRKHLRVRFFFYGQVVAAVLVVGLLIYGAISRKIYNDTRANIDANRERIDFAFDAEYMDSMAFRAFYQLEAQFENSNDILLSDLSTELVDTVIKNASDRVTVFYFEYTVKDRPDQVLYSKHIKGEQVADLIFYNLPQEKFPEFRKKKEELYRQMLEGLREADEALKKIPKDSLTLQP